MYISIQKMNSVLNETSILCEIVKLLDLIDVLSICSANKIFSGLFSNQYFWKIKLEYDYNTDKKKDYQTWLDRYKLARRMGYIYLHQVKTKRTYEFLFNISKEFNFDRSSLRSSFCPGEVISSNRLLDIRAVKAILVSNVSGRVMHNKPILYYLTDECELYFVKGIQNSKECYTHLIDIDVVDFGRAGYPCCSVSYLKRGDIYICVSEEENMRMTYRQDIIRIHSYGTDLGYITRNNTFYWFYDCNNNWVSSIRHMTDVQKAICPDYHNGNISKKWVCLKSNNAIEAIDSRPQSFSEEENVNHLLFEKFQEIFTFYTDNESKQKELSISDKFDLVP